MTLTFAQKMAAVEVCLRVLNKHNIKTYDYYRRTIIANVNALYNDKVVLNEFTDKLSTLIYNQLFAAWREGMADNGLDPKRDFTQEMSNIVSEIADNELQFLRDFGRDVVGSRANETLQSVLTRAESWANRYNDVVDRARLFTSPDNQRLKWIVGDTEHCETCLGLSGVVATKKDWLKLEARGIYPKSTALNCHGDHCQCERVPTDEPLTEGGIPDVPHK